MRGSISRRTRRRSSTQADFCGRRRIATASTASLRRGSVPGLEARWHRARGSVRRHVVRTIAASILSADFGRLADEVRAVAAAGADWIHVDVMDGSFVPPITIGPLVVAAIRRATHLPLDVHLMIETPEKQIAEFVRAGADGVTVHAEASTDVAATLSGIHGAGARPGLALNPPTPLERAPPFADRMDLLLVMSVNPGWGGQPFVEGSMEKLAAARRLRAESGARFVIEVDGGI